MSDTTYLADPGDEGEFSFARFVSLLGITPGQAGTFSPGTSVPLSRAWDSWSTTIFAPVVAPAFVEVYRHAIAARVEEICEIDRQLEGRLTDRTAARSHAAASSFFEGKDEMQANREWVRYVRAVVEKRSPGNLPIVFALQSALYRLPLAQALTAYAWFEFRSRSGKGIPAKAEEEEKTVFERILPQVTVAVGRNIDDSGGATGSLRSI